MTSALVGQSIRARPQNYDGKWQGVDALLKYEIAVDHDESIELTGGASKQCTLANAGTAKIDNGRHVVALDVAGRPAVNAFVEQQPHEVASIKRSLASSINERSALA